MLFSSVFFYKTLKPQWTHCQERQLVFSICAWQFRIVCVSFNLAEFEWRRRKKDVERWKFNLENKEWRIICIWWKKIMKVLWPRRAIILRTLKVLLRTQNLTCLNLQTLVILSLVEEYHSCSDRYDVPELRIHEYWVSGLYLSGISKHNE